MKVIITDLDGTLLDHRTYSFAAAQPALDLLQRTGIPVILCSSKTRAEIEDWQHRLNNHYPFIFENGGSIFVPQDYFPFPCDTQVRLGSPYGELVDALHQASQETGCRVHTFSDMSAREVAEECEMTLDQAVLAKQREYDEPFRIVDTDRRAGLLAAIEHKGKRWTRGGRFHHIMGANDKAEAVRILACLYRRQDRDVSTIGLGDGMNDAEFLNAVDIPILIPSPSLEELTAAVPRGIIARYPGPRGWNDALLRLLT